MIQRELILFLVHICRFSKLGPETMKSENEKQDTILGPHRQVRRQIVKDRNAKVSRIHSVGNFGGLHIRCRTNQNLRVAL